MDRQTITVGTAEVGYWTDPAGRKRGEKSGFRIEGTLRKRRVRDGVRVGRLTAPRGGAR